MGADGSTSSSAPTPSRKADASLVRIVLNGDAARLAQRLHSGTTHVEAQSDGWSLLMMAVLQPKCNPEVVHVLLAAGADVNYRRKPTGETPLSQAARAGRVEVLRMLLAAPGIDVDAPGPTGGAALVHAASEGHADCIAALLAAGCDPNTASEAGDTALMHAANRGHGECVALLAAAPGINPNAVNRSGETALMHAASNLAIVNTILGIPGADPRIVSQTGLTALRQARDYDTAAALIRAGADPEAMVNMLSELCWAAGKGKTDVVRAIIEVGKADASRSDAEGTNALMCAAYGGHADALEVLLKVGGLNPNCCSRRGGITPLRLAAGAVQQSTSPMGFLTQLLGGGAKQALTQLQGVGAQRCRCVELLLQAGAKVDTADEGGLTPLMLAAQLGNTQVVQLLIKAGARVDMATAQGITPLMLAVQYSYEDVVPLLLAAGADPDRCNSGGRTVFELAQTAPIKRMLQAASQKQIQKMAQAQAEADRIAAELLAEEEAEKQKGAGKKDKKKKALAKKQAEKAERTSKAEEAEKAAEAEAAGTEVPRQGQAGGQDNSEGGPKRSHPHDGEAAGPAATRPAAAPCAPTAPQPGPFADPTSSSSITSPAPYVGSLAPATPATSTSGSARKKKGKASKHTGAAAGPSSTQPTAGTVPPTAGQTSSAMTASPRFTSSDQPVPATALTAPDTPGISASSNPVTLPPPPGCTSGRQSLPPVLQAIQHAVAARAGSAGRGTTSACGGQPGPVSPASIALVLAPAPMASVPIAPATASGPAAALPATAFLQPPLTPQRPTLPQPIATQPLPVYSSSTTPVLAQPLPVQQPVMAVSIAPPFAPPSSSLTQQPSPAATTLPSPGTPVPGSGSVRTPGSTLPLPPVLAALPNQPLLLTPTIIVPPYPALSAAPQPPVQQIQLTPSQQQHQQQHSSFAGPSEPRRQHSSWAASASAPAACGQFPCPPPGAATPTAADVRARSNSCPTAPATAPAAPKASGSGAAKCVLDDCDTCVVCMERQRAVAIVPCGHMVLCGTCSDAVQAANNECPMCRQGILSVLVIRKI